MALIWSRAASVRLTSAARDRSLPLRTMSKIVSTSWVKAAMSSKPNIAPEPLMVCMARNTRPIRSASSGLSSSSSSELSSSARSSYASSLNRPAW